MRTATAVLLAALAAPATAHAAAQVNADSVVVTTRAKTKVVIQRDPLTFTFYDAAGRPVLRSVGTAGDSKVVLPIPQNQFGEPSPPPETLYAPLTFLVGSQSVRQFPSSQWQGDLQTVTEQGTLYRATRVTAATTEGDGATLQLATSDPSGRTLSLKIAPIGGKGGLRVSVRPTAADGIATTSASFASAQDEAYRGFGGRHNALDQRRTEFYDWLQQENVSSGSGAGVTATSDPQGDRYMFPNGQHAAYYVQSLFVSPNRYGFLLDRDELAHWRMASDRDDAWQVETSGTQLDYVVVPGGTRQAIAGLTKLNGRQPSPPRWALGTIMDRLVQFPSDPPEQHTAEVEGDLKDLKTYKLHLDGYRIEGWQFLEKPKLRAFIKELRRRGIHPMVYFRLFVGKDTIGTDSPAAYDEALAKGYVATHADGTPYVFQSNFNADGAVIDFTNPDAVRWWKNRITQALKLGADGFMQDFGEQVVADMHFKDGTTGITMHNRIATLAHRATRQAVRAFERSHPRRARVWFFTRAGHSGRPGAAAFEGGNFPGDETTDWTRSAGLASLTTDMLNRAIGGAFGYTADIGGFFDVGPYQPTSNELFVRWTEWAALSPFFRLHGSVQAGTHTPWSYGDATLKLFKRYAALHRRAAPLIARLWKQGRRTGIPPTRPLWLAVPNDSAAAQQDQEWMLGNDVLVAPVVVEGATSRDVYVPPGCWRREGRGARYTGPITRTFSAKLEQLLWFTRCGTKPLGA